MLPANCTGWAVPAAAPKEQPKPLFLFPLTFLVKLLLLRSETQWPWQWGKWKMGLVGRYYSKTLFNAQISSPGDYRVSNAKISVSRCHQVCTGRNFTRCNESAAVRAPSIKKCSNSINVLSVILLPAPPFSRKPVSFLSLLPCSLLLPSPWASITEPFPSSGSDSQQAPVTRRALMTLHRSHRRKWLLSGWQSSFYLSLEPECISASQH